jgi:hypothetical protein
MEISAPILLKQLVSVLISVLAVATLMPDWKMVLSATVQILFAPMLSKLRRANVRHHAPVIVSLSSPSVYHFPLTFLVARQACGGAWRLSVYASTASTTSPTANPTSKSSSWIPYGCIAEGTTSSRRALTAAKFRRADMTPQQCQNLCGNYKYAGVEYG